MRGTPSQRQDDVLIAAARRAATPRPMVAPAIALCVGIVVSQHCGALFSHSVALMGLGVVATGLALCVAMALRGARGWTVTALILLSGAAGFWRHQQATRLPPAHIGRLAGSEPTLVRLQARVVSGPLPLPAEKRNPFAFQEPKPRVRFVAEALSISSADSPQMPTEGGIVVNVGGADLDLSPGECVELMGWLSRPRVPRNPGEIDWAWLQRLQGVYAVLSLDSPELVRRVSPSTSWLAAAQANLRDGLRRRMFEPYGRVEPSETVRVLDAMVLGQRSAAGRAINEAFRRTGTIHILSVSGFHVAVLAGTVFCVLRYGLRCGPRTIAWITIVVLVLYATIAEPNSPILRATVMGVLACLAVIAKRQVCGMNWLALSAFLILLFHPLDLFQAGFQLSFVQVLVLLTIVPRAYQRFVRPRGPAGDADNWRQFAWRRVSRGLLGAMLASLCCWAAALPLTLFHFGLFTPWAPLQSLLIAPLVIVVTVFGFATTFLSAVAPWSAAWVGLPLHGLTELLLAIVRRLGDWHGTLQEVPKPSIAAVAFTYVVALIVYWLATRAVSAAKSQPMPMQNPPRSRLVTMTIGCGALSVTWLAWVALPPAPSGGAYVVHVLSVGSGSAALIQSPRGEAMLVDAGTLGNFDAGETIVRAADSLGVRRLEQIAVSHADYDHFSGVPTVVKRLPVRAVAFNDTFQATSDPQARRLLEELRQVRQPTSRLQAGDRFGLEGAEVTVLWPRDGLPNDWGDNDRSLVLRLEAHGQRVLLPGDIQRDALRALLIEHDERRVDLGCDVLIAPHHGSIVPRETARFLAAVAPRCVIVSTGEDRRRFAKLVAETLGPQCRVLNTREVGAVRVGLLPDRSLTIETPFTTADER